LALPPRKLPSGSACRREGARRRAGARSGGVGRGPARVLVRENKRRGRRATWKALSRRRCWLSSASTAAARRASACCSGVAPGCTPSGPPPPRLSWTASRHCARPRGKKETCRPFLPLYSGRARRRTRVRNDGRTREDASFVKRFLTANLNGQVGGGACVGCVGRGTGGHVREHGLVPDVRLDAVERGLVLDLRRCGRQRRGLVRTHYRYGRGMRRGMADLAEVDQQVHVHPHVVLRAPPREGRDVSSQYGRRDEMCLVSTAGMDETCPLCTGGRGGGGRVRRRGRGRPGCSTVQRGAPEEASGGTVRRSTHQTM